MVVSFFRYKSLKEYSEGGLGTFVQIKMLNDPWDGRLKQIVAEKVKPRNRDEEEIAGYRDVLKLIHDSYEYIRVVPNDILTLHKNLYNYSAKSYKGKFKSGDNVITEKDLAGNGRIRFVPAPAYLTPDLVEELCDQYNQAIQKVEIDPLLLIPCFRFLSIHPFSALRLQLWDGNFKGGEYHSLQRFRFFPDWGRCFFLWLRLFSQHAYWRNLSYFWL